MLTKTEMVANFFDRINFDQFKKVLKKTKTVKFVSLNQLSVRGHGEITKKKILDAQLYTQKYHTNLVLY